MIGVGAAHRDISAAEASAGIKTTEITAGKYKRIASQHATLTEEGRAENRRVEIRLVPVTAS